MHSQPPWRFVIFAVVALLFASTVHWADGPSDAAASSLILAKKGGVILCAVWAQETGSTEAVMPVGEFSEGQPIEIGVRLFGGTDSGPKTARLRTRITKAMGGGMFQIKRDIDLSIDGSEEKTETFSIGTLESGTYRVRLRMRSNRSKGVGKADVYFRVKQDD